MGFFWSNTSTMTHLIGVPGHWYPSHCAASEPDLARADMWKMLHVWWKGSIYNIFPLRSADSIHIIYIDLELIYLYFENIFGCNGVGSDSSEECHFLRWSDYIPSQCKRNSMMANLTRQKAGTRYETLLHSTQLSTVWGSTQLSAAGSGLSATRVGRICFCEWGDANLCWLSMGSLCKSDLILCNDIKKTNHLLWGDWYQLRY